ncbi:MAG: DNA-protecting protein DprA, partial [Rhodoferax sp.]|nr:DNA-protecting protein DprA [Rhodoferax sp.]
MEHEELSCWLRLYLTPGVGNVGARRLLATFGLPCDIFTQSARTLEQVVSQAQAMALRAESPELPTLLQTTWNWLITDPVQRRVLVLGDPAYPSGLLQIEDPPLMLYALGGASSTPDTFLVPESNR